MLELPYIGQITIKHIFYALGDEPILFVCKSNTGARYLCSCCKLYEEWVVGQVSTSAIADMIDDKLTIREVFERQCGHKFFVTWDGDKFEVTNDFPSNVLPRVGAMLELQREKFGSYRRTL